MYNGPIYNRSGQKIGELRSGANPLTCLIVALIPAAVVFTIIVSIFSLIGGAFSAIGSSMRNNDVNNAIEGGAVHYFSESQTFGNVVVTSYGYLLSNNGAVAEFDINAHVGGNYNLTVYDVNYATEDTIEVSVNGGSPTTVNLSVDDSGPGVTPSSIPISLQVGENKLTFYNQTPEDNCDPQVDPTQHETSCLFLDKIAFS